MKCALISHEPAIQSHYERCLKNGCSEKLAEALAFEQGPALVTDVMFNEGCHSGLRVGCNNIAFNHYAKIAKRAGVSTTGKTYLHALGRFAGDPEAWVSDRGDVMRLLEKRNWGVDLGCVKREVEEREEPVIHKHAGGVAPDIIEREFQAEMAAGPDVAPTPQAKADLREKIRQRRKPHWVKS